MDCRALPFRQLPHQPKLLLDYLDHFSKVEAFYPHKPTMKAVRKEAEALIYTSDRAAKITQILRRQNATFGGDAQTQANLDRLSNGAVAVVSGQQVGLFGGPSYATYKALMAIQVADELTRDGIDAVPIFWMATEDHDLDEVRHTTWFHDGRSTHFELPAPALAAASDGASGSSHSAHAANQPVGRIALGPASATAVREASDLLEQQGSPRLAHLLRNSYTPNETYGSAFAKLFAQIFAGRGLVLLDPLDPELHHLAAPILQQAAQQREKLNNLLLQRGKDLEKAGYGAQVKVTSKSTVFFYLEPADAGDGSRQVITADTRGFHAATKSWTHEEFAQAVATTPENFSPNALFRPVVQDFLLPTVAYIGGPAEISYFAQSSVLYQELLGRMPVMLPRSGFTLVDVKAAKLLKQYKLTVEDLWQGSQELRRDLERASVPKELAAKFEQEQKELTKSLAKLGKQIEKLDPTLQGAVATAQRKITFQLDKLRRKTGRAQDQKNAVLTAHQQFLESQLYPHHALQSRELNFLPFLARSGPAALDELQKLSSTKKLGHHFILQWP